MGLRLLLALAILPSLITAEIVYARTNRLDEAEHTQWNKTCGLASAGKAVPYKVMVHVSKKSGETKKCVGVIINKRFVITTATCYYNRTLNNYNDDSEMRVATTPQNTMVVVCGDDGMSCDKGKGLQEVGVKNILYPQIIHYSQEYETVADMSLLEMGDDFTDDRQICTPPSEIAWKGQRVFLLSEDITDQPYYEGERDWNGERTCGEPSICAETLSFKPDKKMATKPSNGLFYVKKNDRFYLLGTLKYVKDEPKIMLIFPYYHDFVCTNTGSCGDGYDKYMFTRETRVVVNGLPLPQVSHCDVNFVPCKYDPLFFRFIPASEMEYLEKSCGKELAPPEGKKKTKWHYHPYMAAIIRGERICSGAFISQVHVITVAHCLFIYNKAEDKDEFLALRDKDPGSYMDPSEYEVRYGSECYADGLDRKDLQLDKCADPEMAKSIKISKVRSIIIDGMNKRADHWMYKYQLVLLELEQPASKDVVIPPCFFPGVIRASHTIQGNEESSYDVTSAGNPDATNSFIAATGNRIEPTNCDEFKATDTGRVRDFNCRDDNKNMVILGKKSPATRFADNSLALLGSQLTFYNASLKKRYLYGLAPYVEEHKPPNKLGAFYPLWRSQRFICWFTGVCYYSGRPDNHDHRFFKIYTPEYRLLRSVINAPVQRAGKNNLSNYESVMQEEKGFDPPGW